jgi:hypothetical protein
MPADPTGTGMALTSVNSHHPREVSIDPGAELAIEDRHHNCAIFASATRLEHGDAPT